MSNIPKEQLDMTKRPDRLGQYVKGHLADFLFANFGEEYLAKSSLNPSFGEVPIPLRKEDLTSFAGGKGLTPDVIGENMVWVMGADPHFAYASSYRLYLQTMFDESLASALVEMAYENAEKEDYDSAFVHARSALILQPENLDAMYAYARITQDMHQDSEDPEFIGRCRAESMEYFELLSLVHPDFADSYYYLGYAYLNLGLYAKAGAAWQTYLTKTDEQLQSGDEETIKRRQEVQQRLDELAEPTSVEAGINEAMAGRFEQAIDLLEPAALGSQKGYWPLHYYLAVSYLGMADATAEVMAASEEPEVALARHDEYVQKSLASLKTTNRINPSHIETMELLATVYAHVGDDANMEKYSRKADLVRRQIAEEMASAASDEEPAGEGDRE